MSAPVRLAVLGDPLRHTRSPELHRAGCAALGLSCESTALRTPLAELGPTLARLAGEGFTGCSVTMPLKQAATGLVATVSDEARRARSVNTITFRHSGAHGETTDGRGFVELLQALSRPPAGRRVALLGAGGAARSLAWALADADVALLDHIARQDPGPDSFPPPAPRWHGWGSEGARQALAAADVVVNATPLGSPELDPVLVGLGRGALVVDLGYGERLTPWVAAARARGLEAVDGLGLLVHQARLSLSHWLAREVPLAPLAAAVGWPR